MNFLKVMQLFVIVAVLCSMLVGDADCNPGLGDPLLAAKPLVLKALIKKAIIKGIIKKALKADVKIAKIAQIIKIAKIAKAEDELGSFLKHDLEPVAETSAMVGAAPVLEPVLPQQAHFEVQAVKGAGSQQAVKGIGEQHQEVEIKQESKQDSVDAKHWA